jgi:hypothetical protein
MDSVTLSQVEELLEKSLLPQADYTDLNTFLNTIQHEDLGEMINLCESEDPKELEYLSYVMSLVFMNEYDQEECRDIDLESLFSQFHRQCVAELCGRMGKWDTSKEDRRLIPAIEPL